MPIIRSLILILIAFVTSQAFAVVNVQVSESKLTIQVKPYAPISPYESWYEQRRDGQGDRFGRREFWTNPSKPAYYRHQEICEAAVKAKVLNIELDLNHLDSKRMWSQMNCLLIDNDSMAIVYPDLLKFLASKRSQLGKMANEYQASYWKYDVSDPNFNLTVNAGSVLNELNEYILNPSYSDPWLKSPAYREALLKGTLKQFNKKQYAGNEPLLSKKPLVLVTHATTIFNNKSIKNFADATIQQAKAKGMSVVYLVSDDSSHDQTWYLNDKNPDRVYFSKNGEHTLLFQTNEVIMMGGFYSECLRTSQLDVITRHFLVSSDALTIHLPIQGIYTHESIDFKKIPRKVFLERARFGSILGGYEIPDENHGGTETSTMNLLTGVPNLKDYTVQIFTDGELIQTSGSGHRVVNLKFSSGPVIDQGPLN